MCVILFKPFGVSAMPKTWAENACEANPHGYGFAIRNISEEGTKLAAVHGFDGKRAADVMETLGADFEVLFHARWSTHGTITTDNLHPFALHTAENTNDPYAYFVHNGVVRIDMPVKGKSDTWHLARKIETSYGEKLTELVRRARWRRKFHNKWGASNKFAIMDMEGVHIIGGELGAWKDGVWASNDSAWEEPTYSRYWSYDWTPSKKSAEESSDAFGICTEEYDWENDTEIGADEVAWFENLRADARKAQENVIDDEERKLILEGAHSFVREALVAEDPAEIMAFLFDYSEEEMGLGIFLLAQRLAAKKQTTKKQTTKKHDLPQVCVSQVRFDCRTANPNSANPCTCVRKCPERPATLLQSVKALATASEVVDAPGC